MYTCFTLFFCCALPGVVPLQAGVARASITPLEENIPTQLGGYGAREGKPAEGILDTLYGKALVLRRATPRPRSSPWDMCGVPANLARRSWRRRKCPV